MKPWFYHILNPVYFFTSNLDLLDQGHAQECIKDGKKYRTVWGQRSPRATYSSSARKCNDVQ